MNPHTWRDNVHIKSIAKSFLCLHTMGSQPSHKRFMVSMMATDCPQDNHCIYYNIRFLQIAIIPPAQWSCGWGSGGWGVNWFHSIHLPIHLSVHQSHMLCPSMCCTFTEEYSLQFPCISYFRVVYLSALIWLDVWIAYNVWLLVLCLVTTKLRQAQPVLENVNYIYRTILEG